MTLNQRMNPARLIRELYAELAITLPTPECRRMDKRAAAKRLAALASPPVPTTGRSTTAILRDVTASVFA